MSVNCETIGMEKLVFFPSAYSKQDENNLFKFIHFVFSFKAFFQQVEMKNKESLISQN